MDSKIDKLIEYYEKSCVYGKIYEDRFDALKKLKKQIDLDAFKDIYIKNIGGTELDDEIYFFSNALILKLSFQIKANGVFADYRAYRISEVSNVRMIDDVTYGKNIILDLEFKDGNKISIDNKEHISDIEEEISERQREINKAILESVFRDIVKFLGE